MEQTLGLIKPCAVKAGYTGPIITQIERAGFIIKALRKVQLPLATVQEFYKVHAQRPFYQDLCNYLASGPLVALLLEKTNAIADFRTLIGATDPSKAAPNTLRAQFGFSIDHNALHGSDAQLTAKTEITLLFPA